MFAAVALMASGRALFAQAKTELVIDKPQLTFALRGLPELRAAFAKTKAAALLADPEVAEAVAFARARNTELGDRWCAALQQLLALDPRHTSLSERGELAAWRLGLDAFSELQFGDSMGKAPEDGMPWYYQPSTSFLAARAHPDAAAAVAAEFRAITDGVRAKLPFGERLADEQSFSGRPALVLAHGGERPEYYEHIVGNNPFSCAFDVDGLLVGAAGPFSDFARLAPGSEQLPPSFEVTIGTSQIAPALLMYLYGIFWGWDESEDPFASYRRLLGIDGLPQISWRVQPVGELLQEDLILALPRPATGLLGALLQGMAPLPAQPLPEGTLLQVRGGFDVRAVTTAIDAWLLEVEQPTLADEKLDGELLRAWTGGFAFALVQPKTGSLLPRLYLSLGIADVDAAQRLLDKLWAAWTVERKARSYEGHDCTQLQIPDLPGGVQPTFAIVGDTLHLAESPTSLRALLQAHATGAAGALDVGTAPRPPGPGRALPGIDIRFDAAQIHTTLQKVWLPLAAIPIGDAEIEPLLPLLPLREMPDVETVAAHLERGRAALRVDGNTILLRSRGVFGGPLGQAIVTAFGPLLSQSLTTQLHWATEQLRTRLALAKVAKIQAAIAAFEKRTGARPKTLGELATSPELSDTTLLLIDGDPAPQAVMHDGKEVAKASFRYYPQGLTVTPQEEAMKVVLIAAPASSWVRVACSDKGVPMIGWGEFASTSIDELEKAARETK